MHSYNDSSSEKNVQSKSSISSNITFGVLVDLYMENCRSRLQPTTFATRSSIINTHILPSFKSMPLANITPKMIKKWQTNLLRRSYSAAYIKALNTQFSMIFNHAVKYRFLTSNPIEAKGDFSKSQSATMGFWTAKEFEKFIVTVYKPQTRLVFEILFWTGITPSELLALTLKDFNFLKKTLTITKNYARHETEGLLLPPGIFKSKRVIQIPDLLCESVYLYALIRSDSNPDNRLFPISKATIKNAMERSCKLSGVKKIRLHALRHSRTSQPVSAATNQVCSNSNANPHTA